MFQTESLANFTKIMNIITTSKHIKEVVNDYSKLIAVVCKETIPKYIFSYFKTLVCRQTWRGVQHGGRFAAVRCIYSLHFRYYINLCKEAYMYYQLGCLLTTPSGYVY